uniref:cyclin-dependent kinase n=1 Tax=Polytomella parva TaxID=51329 RepID=A0A7S0YKV0_9CHLO|mmetsp:Transcript_34176/g.61634  ORF Transcript_34176/g.61634 Transcript_34176/m.61634 type:complete len:315 (+) Transcript_34176:34-978(+)|eukprot:CAMPEP_0175052582 /NCGR_PEP_ID=MMETSP0052_2-20121109/8441_1 /TAXON_ID=51329 ORGANISM="Polytomella parva, Strain SAG 63-3" /NCGR_SAMPLE_ID=MMETSP0052_2 /ASSEMBLY_ACC=CAM_ASM_000194 /LENGTH=314 /DNA_ID=CAMNT_0016317005 /DNA_START=41 /DNA_END=985 /DNA_ORIENTATION=+
MEQYEKIEKVGEGTYGKVYKAKDTVTGNLVALKKCRLEMEEEGVPPTTLREVSILQMLSDSNHIVKLLRVEHTEENNKPCLYLVFEYLNTDMRKWMEKNGRGPSHPLPKPVIKNAMYQLLKGLAYCHKHGVLHRDLKPQNLLVEDSKELIIKIADLGLGRHFSIPLKSYTHEIVTLWYRAPEVLLGATHYGTPVDIWSVGCIFAELVRKTPVFPGDSEFQQLLHIFKLLGTPSEETWPGVTKLRDWHEWPQWHAQDLSRIFPTLEPEGIELLRRMLEYDPARRISAKEAMKHAYFNDLDKVAIDALENPDVRDE